MPSLRQLFGLQLTRKTPRRTETFLLYSQGMPSQNLGFVDPSAASVDVAVAQRDYTIHQSPAVLSSNRAGGTTGAGQSPPPAASSLRLLGP